MTERSKRNRRDARCQLLCRLQTLSYLAFLLCIQQVLERAGYAEVQRLGRLYSRGRTSMGGADLVAVARMGFSSARVLIQAKQGKADRRYVDELRATMLRYGAPKGLLFTLQPVPRQSRIVAAQFPGRPIHIVGGEQLASTMMVLGIGVKAPLSAATAHGHHVVDERYFRALEQEALRIINHPHLTQRL